jgi:ketosteroid isomerase-like protein
LNDRTFLDSHTFSDAPLGWASTEINYINMYRGHALFQSRLLYPSWMAIHISIPPEEAADRLAIRELVDAYAHCADRRDATGQMALFTEDTSFAVYMDAKSDVPSQEFHGRDALAPVFDDLNQYVTTTHFNGQSTVVLGVTEATGVSYCLAHHVSVHGSGRSLMIASIRYLDRFTKIDGAWYFAQRRLLVDWIETRKIIAPTA